MKKFYGWLLKNNAVLSDPTDQLQLKPPRSRLGTILTHQEIEAIMSQPNLRTVAGLRNRTMLETFYATGIRRRELINVRLVDVNLQTQILFIKQGKGKKDRVVPIGDRGCSWLKRYLGSARPYLIKGYDPGYLFLTHWGGPFKPDSVGDMVRDYMVESGITKRGSCHLFRRTMATGMLENGADIRYVQAILGHNEL
ncbi:tyrosine-type recombinase/integrase [candidate division CSSED10-310 bacterium]|uniref:Tyrosine-type recombinase/integrase n=1 Tax=candidate division CSSED10-310 bacterium TaxID=2855610 RepID=A0ABV6YW17_UNCC1